MTIIIKKSQDLLMNEKDDICSLFERVFEKEMTIRDFDKKFISNIFKTSYHALLLNDEKKIVGCYSSIPQQYNYYGKEVTFGLSVDTMIDEEYRGSPFTLKKLANKVYESMKSDGISFVFGFPNDNVYLVRKKILKWKDIGKLDFYILPINIGALKSNLRHINFLSKLFASLINVFTRFEQNSGTDYPIEKKNNDEYISARYDKTYNIIKTDEEEYFSYKVYDEDSVKTAYIIDVYPLNKSNLQKAVKMIYTKEKNYIDLILYVGALEFSVSNLLKVPEKFQPKNVYMSGQILDETIIDNRVFELKNWNINLSNYDVR